MAVVIENLQMKVESESYIDAMHAILTHKGWISVTKPMLAGMTVSAFRFTVNRRLSAESHTAYNWQAENFLAADFIGVASSQAAGFSFEATFPLYREHAINEIKSVIDRGMGVVIWKNQFVVVSGYDDEKQSLLVSDGYAGGLVLLPYEKFGLNESPYWYYQCFEDRIAMDHLEICRESLMQAVHKWETHDPMLPQEAYACGAEAYEAILAALRSGEYDREGLPLIIRGYAAAKRDIRLYFAELKSYWSGLAEAAQHYAAVEAAFREAVCMTSSACVPDGSRAAESAETVGRLIELFTDARQAEECAIEVIKHFMRETLEIREGDIALR